MSKSLDDILGTASTDVDESVAPVVDEETANTDLAEDDTSAKQADIDTPANPDGATNDRAVAQQEPVVEEPDDVATTAENDSTPADVVEPEVQHDDSVHEVEEVAFRPYMLILNKPTRIFRNKQMTKPDGYYTGVVKVLTQDKNTALVEFMVVANGVRRRARAYIII